MAEDLPCARCGYNLRTLRPEAACPECGEAVAASIATAIAWRTRLSRPLDLHFFPPVVRVLYGLLGIVVPTGCFCLAATEASWGVSAWQSGRLQDYAGVMLGYRGSMALWPLALYAMISLGQVLVQPIPAARRRLVRLGLYTGVMLSVLCLLLVFASMNGLVGVVCAIPGIALAGGTIYVLAGWAVRTDTKRRRTRRLDSLWASILLAVAIVIGVVTLGSFFLITGPIWAFLVYSLTLVMARRTAEVAAEMRPLGLLPLLAFASVWIGSLGLAIRGAIISYGELPVTNPYPGCYIATAAARGHRRLVGAQPIALAGGRVLWVNRQLRVLKAAELALRAACPRLHRALRVAYDAIGPPLARRMTHPLLADAAYLALAPLAGLARLALRRVLHDADELIERLYPS